MPLHNPIGFGPLDFAELGLAAILAGLALVSGLRISPKAAVSAVLLFCLPIGLRIALLRRLPIPVPDLYDEFGHLLVADTLRHWRLANAPHPMHRFFETFFVLQQPTYSSIYPLGNGLLLALFPHPWIGVLLASGMFCALCYWMLRGWVPPGWALLGGLFAALEFGPLNQWTNSYWGGGVAACAGCLVFGSLPRILNGTRRRDAGFLGLGFALHILTRPYESIFLFAAVAAYFVLFRIRHVPWNAVALVLCAVCLSGLQNKRVTGSWTTVPYSLSQYQYGVPAALTFQRPPVPHVPLTPEQALDYRMQTEFHPGAETFATYGARLAYRIRYYRFYFLPPLYLALLAFLWRMRSREWLWVAGTCLLFALGTNFFPAFQYHYLAGVVCLFVLMSVQGLRSLPVEAARALTLLCVAQFAFFYAVNVPQRPAQRRVDVAARLHSIPGKLVVYVRYWPNHVFQDEWVYNGADIDAQRVVMARDLGNEENLKLASYYGDRSLFLLEPDARPPRVSKWEPAPKPALEADPARAKKEEKRPLLELEQVR